MRRAEGAERGPPGASRVSWAGAAARDGRGTPPPARPTHARRAARRYYGLLGQRFSLLHTKWQTLFEECFRKQYALIPRLETNKARLRARRPVPCSCVRAAWSLHLVELKLSSGWEQMRPEHFNAGAACVPPAQRFVGSEGCT